uniref:Aldolase_II domain-containing protein n=1 Tax=Rhabditophanes sp. KR3021 TaxID=114890 RepID=A0AC35U218_9BILA
MTAELFGELMNQFYHLGWMFGSSGGMAIVEGDLAYYSPSSVQKERLTGMDLFVFNVSNNTLSSRPQNAAIKESACTPLFSHILNQDLKCVIHTHSKYSNLITQLLSGSDMLRISHQEMIKGVINRKTGKAHDYNDTIEIPIIENEPFEHLLLPALARTLNSHPEASGILVIYLRMESDEIDAPPRSSTSRVHFATSTLPTMGRAFTHPLIQDCTLPEKMRIDAVYLAMVSCQRYKTNYKKIAKDIHSRLMKKFGGDWNVIVGERFGLQIAYDPNSLLYMFCGVNIAICIYRCS